MLSSFYISIQQNFIKSDIIFLKGQRHTENTRKRKGEKNMQKQAHYLISDAAKKVEVESHVLRYWEDELEIPIKRNELGHRYYTEDDVERFREIKNLKEQGLQLKAIRMILKDGKLERLKGDESLESIIGYSGTEERAASNVEQKPAKEKQPEQKPVEEEKEAKQEERKKELDKYRESGQARHMIEVIGKKELSDVRQESKEEKSMRLQILLQHMIADAVRSNNRELCDDIKETVLKEMDYQFRQQEEREEEKENERIKREEEHYKRLDELLRSCSRKGRKKEAEKPDQKQSRFRSAKKNPAT